MRIKKRWFGATAVVVAASLTYAGFALGANGTQGPPPGVAPVVNVQSGSPPGLGPVGVRSGPTTPRVVGAPKVMHAKVNGADTTGIYEVAPPETIGAPPPPPKPQSPPNAPLTAAKVATAHLFGWRVMGIKHGRKVHKAGAHAAAFSWYCVIWEYGPNASNANYDNVYGIVTQSCSAGVPGGLWEGWLGGCVQYNSNGWHNTYEGCTSEADPNPNPNAGFYQAIYPETWYCKGYYQLRIDGNGAINAGGVINYAPTNATPGYWIWCP